MLKNVFLTESSKCDMSNFSEFHQDDEYVSHILFYLDWNFADFTA